MTCSAADDAWAKSFWANICCALAQSGSLDPSAALLAFLALQSGDRGHLHWRLRRRLCRGNGFDCVNATRASCLGWTGAGFGGSTTAGSTDSSGAPDVSSAVRRLALQPLRRKVLGGADDRASHCVPGERFQLRAAKFTSFTTPFCSSCATRAGPRALSASMSRVALERTPRLWAESGGSPTAPTANCSSLASPSGHVLSLGNNLEGLLASFASTTQARVDRALYTASQYGDGSAETVGYTEQGDPAMFSSRLGSRMPCVIRRAGGSSLCELGPAADVEFFFECIHSFAVQRMSLPDIFLLTDRLYKRYLREDEVELASLLMKQLRTMFETTSASAIDLTGLSLALAVTRLGASKANLAELFDKYFECFEHCTESAKQFSQTWKFGSLFGW